jgi:hypothetical protein
LCKYLDLTPDQICGVSQTFGPRVFTGSGAL